MKRKKKKEVRGGAEKSSARREGRILG